jgi:hypothetical protein
MWNITRTPFRTLVCDVRADDSKEETIKIEF